MLSFKTKIRRIRFWWHLTFAVFRKYRIRFTLAVLLVVLTTFSVYKTVPYIFKNNVVTIGYVGVFNLENIPTSVLTLATQPLIATDNSGKPIPALASNWTVTADGKTYIVFLKDNLKWHDDTPVVASDISIPISNVKITALNNKAIQFELPGPIFSFPLALDKPVFKANTFYGTGQFRIVKVDQINNVVKKISLAPKSNYLPRVDIKFYETEEQAQAALKLGDIKTLNVANAKNFETWQNLRVKTKEDDSEIVTIFYDNQDSNLSSKDLRQALSFAINRTNMDGTDAYSPISKNSWAYNETVKRYDYNIAKAKELLTKSNSENAHITLSFTKDLEKVANNIKQDWQALGVHVELKAEKQLPKQFQALLAVNKLSPDPDQYSLWHSTQKDQNITNYKNVKIDKILEDARTTQDEQKRKDLYFDFQRFLVEDCPVTFLYNPNKYGVTYKNTENLISKLSM